MTDSRYDIVIIGAGIVGLATAWQLQRRHPSLALAVIDKETRVAVHQSGHNSGVLHSGLYYQPGSLRTRLCVEGKRALEEFAATHGITMRRCGKLIVAIDERELPRLEDLARRAVENHVEVTELGSERMREIEPAVRGLRALHVPATGVIDFGGVARALAGDIEAAGGALLLGRRVSAIAQRADEVVVSTNTGDVQSRALIACAGLESDRIAAMTGHRDGIAIVPVRGDYWTLSRAAAQSVRALIYPVPDPRYPFLGVHFTRTIHDEVHAGPNAVLALAREGYHGRDVSARDVTDMLRFRGFYRMAAAQLRTGALETWRNRSRGAYAASLRRYVPAINAADLTRGVSGVRAQAVDRHGRFLDDFAFGGSGRVLHVRNAPSPAATASLAIGAYLAAEAERRLGL